MYKRQGLDTLVVHAVNDAHRPLAIRQPQEVEAVAFELGDGETSDMISTDDGYYFIKCISKLDREKTEQNKVTILQKRQQEQFNDDYEHFVKKAARL